MNLGNAWKMTAKAYKEAYEELHTRKAVNNSQEGLVNILTALQEYDNPASDTDGVSYLLDQIEIIAENAMDSEPTDMSRALMEERLRNHRLSSAISQIATVVHTAYEEDIADEVEKMIIRMSLPDLNTCVGCTAREHEIGYYQNKLEELTDETKYFRTLYVIDEILGD